MKITRMICLVALVVATGCGCRSTKKQTTNTAQSTQAEVVAASHTATSDTVSVRTDTSEEITVEEVVYFPTDSAGQRSIERSVRTHIVRGIRQVSQSSKSSNETSKVVEKEHKTETLKQVEEHKTQPAGTGIFIPLALLCIVLCLLHAGRRVYHALRR